MAFSSIVVIGASAGGVPALRSFAEDLTTPLPAPILIVLHVGALPSELPNLLNAAGVSPAKHGEDGEAIRPGHIYVAPPDRHMIVVNGHIRLTRGPKENWARPAIDPLFRSAAEEFGPAAIGVVLTGNLNDGSAGLYEIKRRGGIAIAQEPDDAANPNMPRNAAAHVDLDYCLPLAEIPGLLARLINEEEGVVTASPRKKARQNGGSLVEGEVFDRPITITCPDCGGALRRGGITLALLERQDGWSGTGRKSRDTHRFQQFLRNAYGQRMGVGAIEVDEIELREGEERGENQDRPARHLQS